MFGFDKIREKMLKPVYLFSYRLSAFAVITGSLLFMAVWAVIMVFYMINTSWVAPTFLSTTSDRMLQFSSGLTTATQTIETDKITLQQAQRDVVFARNNVDLLTQVTTDLQAYAKRNASFDHVKSEQIVQSQILANQLDGLKNQFLAGQKAGLLTAQEVVQGSTYIQQFQNGLTDQKQASDTLKIAIEGQLLQASEQLRQAQNDIHTKEETVLGSQAALRVAEQTMSTLKTSVYYDAFSTQKGLNLAFVAYDNHDVKIGAAVYSCYLQFLFCHKVGTIRHIYHDEQLVEFPLFNVKLSRTVRGIYIDLDVTDSDAMHNLILFISKPFLI